MNQPVWQLVRQQRNANAGPTKFSASLTERRAAVEYSCFSSDPSESRNRPANKEICGTERGGHEEDRAAPSHTNALNLQSQPGIWERKKNKKIRKRVIIVAAYTFINLCGLDTTSHCSFSPGASSPREAAWLAAQAYSWLFWKISSAVYSYKNASSIGLRQMRLKRCIVAQFCAQSHL